MQFESIKYPYKIFFFENPTCLIPLNGVIMKGTHCSFTDNNMREPGSATLSGDLKLGDIKIKFSQNFFNRAKNPNNRRASCMNLNI